MTAAAPGSSNGSHSTDADRKLHEGIDTGAPETGDKRIEFDELDPGMQRVVVATRRLIIGVGGVGVEAIIAIGHGMREHDMRFGELDMDSRTVVEALVIDSNQDELRGMGVNAELLEEMGVPRAHLYVDDQQAEFNASGMDDRLTPGIPSKQDASGCQADPRVGQARYALLREYPDKKQGGVSSNPKRAVEDMMSEWKAPQQPRIDKHVRIDIIGGLSGGTGPIAAAIAADAMAACRDALGREHQVTTRLYTMSGESLSKLNDGLQDKRHMNSVVQMMYLNRQTYEGGVNLPNGEFAPGVPDLVYVVDGQSSSVALRGYQPIKIVSKVIMAEIAGEGSNNGSMSNIAAHVQQQFPAPSNDPDEVFKPLGRFGSVGACETLTNPPAVLLERDKKRDLFVKTVGLGAPTAKQKERVAVAKQGVLAANLIKQLTDEITAPSLGEESILKVGEEAAVGTNAENKVRYFNTILLPGLRTKVAGGLSKRLSDTLAKLEQSLGTLLQEEGINTENQLLNEISAAVENLRQTCEAQKKLLEDRLKKDLEPQVEPLKTVLHDRKIPMFFGRDKAIKALADDVTMLVNHMNNIGATTRDFRICELMLQDLIPQLRAKLDTAIRANEDRIRDARGVLSNIQTHHDPEKTGATDIDLRMSVDPHWNVDPVQLRKGLHDFSAGALEVLVDSIRLMPEDIDILGRINPEIAEAVGSTATPLVRESRFFDQKKQRSTAAIYTLPKTLMEVDKSGKAVALKGVPVPQGFTAVPVATAGKVMGIKEVHGVSPLEREYFVEGFEKLLRLKPADREKFFTQKGDMERMLPPFAQALAEAKLKKNNKGKIVECSGCKLSFYRPPVSSTAPKNRISMEPAPVSKEEETAYCCDGCRS